MRFCDASVFMLAHKTPKNRHVPDYLCTSQTDIWLITHRSALKAFTCSIPGADFLPQRICACQQTSRPFRGHTFRWNMKSSAQTNKQSCYESIWPYLKSTPKHRNTHPKHEKLFHKRTMRGQRWTWFESTRIELRRLADAWHNPRDQNTSGVSRRKHLKSRRTLKIATYVSGRLHTFMWGYYAIDYQHIVCIHSYRNGHGLPDWQIAQRYNTKQHGVWYKTYQ